MSKPPSQYIKFTTPNELGKEIRKKRKAQALRIDDAASMMGISKNTLSEIENGASGVSIGKILLVANELGVEIFLRGE